MLAASSTLPVVSSEQLLCCRWHARLSPALCGCSSYYTLQYVPSWHKGTAVDHSCLTNMHACKECQQAAHEEDTLACDCLLHKQHAPSTVQALTGWNLRAFCLYACLIAFLSAFLATPSTS